MVLRIQKELKDWQETYRDYSVTLADIDTSVSPAISREVIQQELKRCEAKISELFERLYLHQTSMDDTIRSKKRVTRKMKKCGYHTITSTAFA